MLKLPHRAPQEEGRGRVDTSPTISADLYDIRWGGELRQEKTNLRLLNLRRREIIRRKRKQAACFREKRVQFHSASEV